MTDFFCILRTIKAHAEFLFVSKALHVPLFHPKLTKICWILAFCFRVFLKLSVDLKIKLLTRFFPSKIETKSCNDLSEQFHYFLLFTSPIISTIYPHNKSTESSTNTTCYVPNCRKIIMTIIITNHCTINTSTYTPM